MRQLKSVATCALVCIFALIVTLMLLAAQPSKTAPAAAAQPDHQHDFDFEFGSWKTHIRRLLHPLSGSQEWADLDGTSVVRKVWDGRANLGELEVSNSAMHLEGLSMRLYNPESRQWSIYWSNAEDGALGTGMVGQFNNGRGEFFDQEVFEGRTILVRYVWSNTTSKSPHFEQSFSTDGGKTWEVNWITDQVRDPVNAASATRSR